MLWTDRTRATTPGGERLPVVRALLALFGLAFATLLPALHASQLDSCGGGEDAAGRSACCGHHHDDGEVERGTELGDDDRSPVPDHDHSSCELCKLIFARMTGAPRLAANAPVWTAAVRIADAALESRAGSASAHLISGSVRGPPAA